MNKRYCLLLFVGLALLLPGTIQAQICGPFTDVQASDLFCPFIFQVYTNGITLGTTATTYAPDLSTTRDQMAAFLGRSLDATLQRATIRTAIGKTWLPTYGPAGIATDVGGAIDDIVTDGRYLWIARSDNKILKYDAADRRLLETWTMPEEPKKLGIFAGSVWAVGPPEDFMVFNPTDTPGTVSPFSGGPETTGSYPTLAFDGASVWKSNTSTKNVLIYPVGAADGFIYTASGNLLGMVFDGSSMWLLQSDLKFVRITVSTAGNASIAETLSLPAASDCQMVFDGVNIWIPDGASGVVRVIHPSPNSNPSTIIKTISIPDVSFPYAAGFDGTTIMIGGVNNGYVALYKASDLSFIRTINTGLTSIRSIASDGRTFNIGDASGTKFVQF